MNRTSRTAEGVEAENRREFTARNILLLDNAVESGQGPGLDQSQSD
jgi:hypothetical protein